MMRTNIRHGLTYFLFTHSAKTMRAHLIRLCVCSLTLLSSNSSLSAEVEHTLLVYGDSLSAAYGIDEDEGWVTLLSYRLNLEQYPFRVINGSVSGETTTGGLERLPAMLDSYTPDILILELGGNDGLRGLPLEILKQNMESMIELAENSGAQIILTGIQIPPNYGPRYAVPFAEIYAELADEKNLALVPFLIEGIPEQTELMQRDGIHPKAEAQILILDNVWPVLEPALERITERNAHEH